VAPKQRILGLAFARDGRHGDNVSALWGGGGTEYMRTLMSAAQAERPGYIRDGKGEALRTSRIVAELRLASALQWGVVLCET
jgi:hypothetical protein